MFVPRIARRQPRESLNPPHEQDLERIQELREQGSRMTLPHPVRAYLAFDTEKPAREAGGLLGKDGFSCTVRSSPDGSWVLTAIVQVVPTAGAITRLRERFEAITRSLGGSYRGWDAPVVY